MVGTELLKKMKTLLAFVDSGIVIADSSYNIVYVNPSAVKFLGKKMEELIGRPIKDVFSMDNWGKISACIDKVKQSNTPVRTHVEEKNKFLKVGISAITVEEKYTGFILNMLDITVEEHLLIQRSELTSMLINELKDPIYTLYDLFFNRRALTGDDAYVEQAKESSRLLMNALETLLDINQLTSGVLNLEFEDIDAAMVIKSCVKSIEPFANRQGLVVYSSYKHTAAIAKLDREKFTKGLINLLSLAVKEGREKDVLCIDVANYKTDGRMNLLLTISNTGTGTAASIFENITDKQTFSHLKEEEKLYVEVLTAKRLIQAHSGQMDVISELGVGSSYLVTLPVME